MMVPSTAEERGRWANDASSSDLERSVILYSVRAFILHVITMLTALR
jgi:hypothetical protein